MAPRVWRRRSSILADTMTPPSGPRPPRLLELPDGAVIWAGRKDDDVPPVAAARQAALAEAEDEYRRLLYVAMTRAADRLIVCGADGERRGRKAVGTTSCVEPLQPFLVEEDRRRRKSLALSQSAAERCGRDCRPRRQMWRRSSKHRASVMAARSRPAPEPPRSVLALAVLGVRGGYRRRNCIHAGHLPPSGARRSPAGESCIG